jgi:hypothetical protein
MEVPNPNCPRNDCRYIVGVEMTTAMYYQPVYNKHGQNVNPDGNVTSGEMTCSACQNKWKYKTQYGKTNYQKVLNYVPEQETNIITSDDDITAQSDNGFSVTTSRVFIGN